MEEITVGDIFIREYPEGVKFLILLLSSDKEPGWKTDEDIWRCVQFQICGDGLLGAQIVLYNISELNEFYPAGKFEIPGVVE